MTFGANPHTHLSSFYSGCLRKAWYTKCAEVRGGRMKINVISRVGAVISGIVHSNQPPNAAVKCARWGQTQTGNLIHTVQSKHARKNLRGSAFPRFSRWFIKTTYANRDNCNFPIRIPEAQAESHMPQKSSQNNRRRRWWSKLQLCQRPGDQGLPEVFKRRFVFCQDFSSFWFFPQAVKIYNLSSDKWNNYVWFFYSLSKSMGVFQFNNQHFLLCHCCSTKY